MLNFPDSPSVGQVFVSPSGISAWTWDGTKWTSGPGAGGGGYVPLAGGTMSGPLTLAGAPTVNLHAATKLYVDGSIGAGGPFLPISGGQMSGLLSIANSTGGIAQPTVNTGLMVYGASGAGDAAYLVFHRPGRYAVAFGLDTDNQLAWGGWSMGTNRRVLWDTGNLNPGAYLPLAGGTLSGALTVNESVQTGGSNASYWFADRGGANNWALYATAGSARLYSGIFGDTMLINNTNGNVSFNGTHIYLGGATGDVNTTSTAGIIYADNNTLVLKCPATNGMWIQNSGGTNIFQISNGGTVDIPYSTLKANGLISNNIYALRMMNGSSGYGALWYNDGGATYLLLTNNNDPYGGFNGLRPFRADNSNGLVSIGNGLNVNGQVQITPSTYAFIFAGLTFYPQVNNTFVCGSGGNAWNTVCSYAYQNSSDASVKTDIAPAPSALAAVSALVPKTFKWIDGPDTTRTHHGFVAQDVASVLGEDFGGYIAPETVDPLGNPTVGIAGLAYHELTAVLWKGVQELASQMEKLTVRLEKLESAL